MTSSKFWGVIALIVSILVAPAALAGDDMLTSFERQQCVEECGEKPMYSLPVIKGDVSVDPRCQYGTRPCHLVLTVFTGNRVGLRTELPIRDGWALSRFRHEGARYIIEQKYVGGQRSLTARFGKKISFDNLMEVVDLIGLMERADENFVIPLKWRRVKTVISPSETKTEQDAQSGTSDGGQKLYGMGCIDTGRGNCDLSEEQLRRIRKTREVQEKEEAKSACACPAYWRQLSQYDVKFEVVRVGLPPEASADVESANAD